jgi:hypothetical protein
MMKRRAFTFSALSLPMLGLMGCDAGSSAPTKAGSEKSPLLSRISIASVSVDTTQSTGLGLKSFNSKLTAVAMDREFTSALKSRLVGLGTGSEKATFSLQLLRHSYGASSATKALVPIGNGGFVISIGCHFQITSPQRGFIFGTFKNKSVDFVLRGPGTAKTVEGDLKLAAQELALQIETLLKSK